MDPIICTICKKTNHIPEKSLIVVSSFAQQYQAKNALEHIEASHISFVWEKVFVQKDYTTLILQLHGIKDIVNLQALYVESMCQENNALTVDILSQKVHQEKLLSTLS